MLFLAFYNTKNVYKYVNHKQAILKKLLGDTQLSQIGNTLIGKFPNR